MTYYLIVLCATVWQSVSGKVSGPFAATVVSDMRSQEVLSNGARSRVSRSCSAGSCCVAGPFPFTSNITILMTQARLWALNGGSRKTKSRVGTCDLMPHLAHAQDAACPHFRSRRKAIFLNQVCVCKGNHDLVPFRLWFHFSCRQIMPQLLCFWEGNVWVLFILLIPVSPSIMSFTGKTLRKHCYLW